MTQLVEKIRLRIDKKLALLQQHRPLSAALVSKLKEQFSLDMVYNSNAIEGNRLTLKETYLVLSEGITVKGKSLKDHLEAQNHSEAISYLYELIEYDKKNTFSEHLIRSLQALIVQDSNSIIAGKYRTGSVMITGSKHIPPDAYEIPHLMNQVVKFFSKMQKKMPTVELAAIIHHRISNIHPFDDGNGRTARLVMNLILMQSGYPLVVILKNDRKKYYTTLEKADLGNLAPFVAFVAQAVERSLDIYLKVVVPQSTSLEKFIPLSAAAKKSPYSEKYLNLLAGSGKLEAHKEGRNWLTSIGAIERYRAGRLRKKP